VRNGRVKKMEGADMHTTMMLRRGLLTVHDTGAVASGVKQRGPWTLCMAGRRGNAGTITIREWARDSWLCRRAPSVLRTCLCGKGRAISRGAQCKARHSAWKSCTGAEEPTHATARHRATNDTTAQPRSVAETQQRGEARQGDEENRKKVHKREHEAARSSWKAGRLLGPKVQNIVEMVRR